MESTVAKGEFHFVFIRYVLGFGLWLTFIINVWLYFREYEFSFSSLLVATPIVFFASWLMGKSQWKKLNMELNNIKHRQAIETEDDEYARNN